MKKIIFAVIVIIIAYKLFFSDNWTGFYYPDGCLTCEEDYIFKHDLKSKKECLKWADNLQDKRNNPKDDFECGKNCKDWGEGMYMCEETVDY